MNRDGEQSAWRRTSCDFNDGRSSVKSSDLKVSKHCTLEILQWRNCFERSRRSCSSGVMRAAPDQNRAKLPLAWSASGQQVDSKWTANVLESTRSGCRFQAGQRSNLFTNRLAYQQARLTTGTFSNRLIYILAD